MATSAKCHVVYSTNDLESETQSGVLGNKPEVRKRLIVNTLRSHSDAFCFEAVTTAANSLQEACPVHSSGFLQFLSTAWDEWTALWDDHLIDDKSYLEPFCTTKVSRALVPAYVAPRFDGLQREGTTVLGKLAYYALDRETPITENTTTTLRWDLAVVRKAVSVIGPERPLVYCPVTMPGHHSGDSYFGGFCFINNAVIAAKQLQSTRGFARVAIVDVDYHAPNGTIQLVWNDPSVLLISLHADPRFEYPFNSGWADQVGEHNNVLNIPLARGTNISQYLVHLARAVERLKAWAPDAMVVSLGLDTLKDDPVAYPSARFDLHPPDFAAIGQALLHTAPMNQIPRLVMQEGGYLLSHVPEAVRGFLMGR